MAYFKSSAPVNPAHFENVQLFKIYSFSPSQTNYPITSHLPALRASGRDFQFICGKQHRLSHSTRRRLSPRLPCSAAYHSSGKAAPRHSAASSRPLLSRISRRGAPASCARLPAGRPALPDGRVRSEPPAPGSPHSPQAARHPPGPGANGPAATSQPRLRHRSAVSSNPGIDVVTLLVVTTPLCL